MVKKNVIREDGFNVAIVEKIYQNGDIVVTLQRTEMGEDGVEIIVGEETNIVFENGSLELTEEELNELHPIPDINNLE